MNLETIKQQTTWNDAASTINSNTQKIGSELTRLKSATYKNKGYFATAESLVSAYPVASAGCIAYVGTKYPYAIYTWNAQTLTWVNSGQTGGSDSIPLDNYFTKDEANATFIDNQKLTDTLGSFYPKQEADNTFATKEDLGSSFNGYYTKSETDDKFVTREQVEDALEPCVTEDELNLLLGDIYTKAEANSTFVSGSTLNNRLEESYYTKSQSDERYATREFYSNYYTKTETDAKFVSPSELALELGQYYTKSQADSNFLSNASLTTKLADYYTKKQSDSRYVTSDKLNSAVGNCATKVELSAATAALTTQIDNVNSKLGNYYPKTDGRALENRVGNVEKKFGDYYTKEETIDAIKGEYVVLTKEEYDNLAVKEDKLYFCIED